ncbi:MAG: hypothetical protein GX806_06230 [Lentisphaerae bacterium]|nr:hypothetical protein [Lentisphaerota bacterium]
MSAIIINMSPEYALVATDTLVVKLPDYRPDGFTEKARLWPAAKMIVAGTGLAGFSDHWLDWLMSSAPVAADIEAVDKMAPETLLEMYRGCDQQTTIYHIGVAADGLIKGFRYSSVELFSSQPIPCGQTAKPAAGAEPNPANPRDVMQVMRDQKALQDSLPANQRVYIGGQMYVVDLNPDGTSQSGYVDIF